MTWLALWLALPFALPGTTAHAQDGADIAPALVAPKKKVKWEAKGKAIEPYGLGNAKRSFAEGA